MSWIVRGGPVALAVTLALTIAGCGSDNALTGTGNETAGAGSETTANSSPAPVVDPGDGGNYQPHLDPANFVDVVDNPYLPFKPGMMWVYEGESEGEAERTEVVVTSARRDIEGISATVVRDTVSAGGRVAEDTYDWYAQDKDGNVWYLGEDTTAYEEDGTTSNEGSWEYGVDGALPGIVMLANPTVGDSYRQEYYEGHAEDVAEVMQVGETKKIGIGEYTDVVVTKDWNPLDPEIIENKYFAPGVGLIFATHTAGPAESEELVGLTPGS